MHHMYAQEANDAQAIWERAQKIKMDQEGKEFDGKYRGLAAAPTFNKLNKDAVRWCLVLVLRVAISAVCAAFDV